MTSNNNNNIFLNYQISQLSNSSNIQWDVQTDLDIDFITYIFLLWNPTSKQFKHYRIHNKEIIQYHVNIHLPIKYQIHTLLGKLKTKSQSQKKTSIIYQSNNAYTTTTYVPESINYNPISLYAATVSDTPQTLLSLNINIYTTITLTGQLSGRDGSQMNALGGWFFVVASNTSDGIQLLSEPTILSSNYTTASNAPSFSIFMEESNLIIQVCGSNNVMEWSGYYVITQQN